MVFPKPFQLYIDDGLSQNNKLTVDDGETD